MFENVYIVHIYSLQFYCYCKYFVLVNFYKRGIPQQENEPLNDICLLHDEKFVATRDDETGIVLIKFRGFVAHSCS